jgi:hypothetical protein
MGDSAKAEGFDDGGGQTIGKLAFTAATPEMNAKWETSRIEVAPRWNELFCLPVKRTV